MSADVRRGMSEFEGSIISAYLDSRLVCIAIGAVDGDDVAVVVVGALHPSLFPNTCNSFICITNAPKIKYYIIVLLVFIRIVH